MKNKYHTKMLYISKNVFSDIVEVKAISNSEEVGWIIFNPEANRITDFYVIDQYRKRKIGTSLFANLVSTAGNYGVEKIYVSPTPEVSDLEKEDLIEIYKKLGFQRANGTENTYFYEVTRSHRL